MATVKTAVARVLDRINPYWDEIPWNRARNAHMKSLGLPVAKKKAAKPFRKRLVHVITMANDGPGSENFGPGMGNIHFEIGNTLGELLGSDQVTVFGINPGESPSSWHKRLVDLVKETDATHIICHAEADPGDPHSWTLDELFSMLLQSWDGVLMGVTFDSSHKWVHAKNRRLGKMSPQFLLVDICIPGQDSIVKGRREVGPVNMAISAQTLKLFDARTQGLEKKYDVSFFGALYPYRVAIIDELKILGITVAVNPHRSDHAVDFESSRSNQPSYLDYIAGIAQSRVTINFSQSSGSTAQQLKTRLVEATSVGTFVLTDDRERTREYFEPHEYGYFSSIEELPGVVTAVLSRGKELDDLAVTLREKGRKLARNNFWQGVDEGLAARNLPRVFTD